jgi:hypothetical protein
LCVCVYSPPLSQVTNLRLFLILDLGGLFLSIIPFSAREGPTFLKGKTNSHPKR